MKLTGETDKKPGQPRLFLFLLPNSISKNEKLMDEQGKILILIISSICPI
jgi:hypothetical protein